MTIAALLSAVLLAAGVPQEATSGSPAAADDPVQIGPVVVEGRRLQETVRAFVDEVAAAPRGSRLARWDREICVGVSNMDVRYAQFMVDRVSLLALDAGLEIGEPGCRPEILIVATSDAPALAARLVADNPNGFRPARNSTDLGAAALETFQTSAAPVRWWHISMPVSVDTGEPAIALRGETAPNVAVRDASRLRANVRDDLSRVIILLDVSKIGRISFGALSDYVAMVALAQIDPSADTAPFPTVLNLFSDREVQGLTDWDRDYLRGLYAARRDRARSSQQEREIADSLMDAQAEADAAASAEQPE